MPAQTRLTARDKKMITPSSYHLFFQAEDGIRDAVVTGVQTCALPISPPPRRVSARHRRSSFAPRTTSRCMAAWVSPGRSIAISSIGVRTRSLCRWAARRIGKRNSSRACAAATPPEGTRMDFDDTPEDAAFRADARAWLDANAPTEFRDALERASFGYTEIPGHDPVRMQQAWQKRKFDAGWACVHWPRAFGGRDATPIQRVIWQR